MYLAYTPEQDKLRHQLREYFAALMTDERRAALQTPGGAGGAGGDYADGTTYKEIVRQLGADGWLAMSWPEEYGGRDASAVDQLIFTDEAAAAGVPVPVLTISTVGPTIMRYGTAEQKSFYLPRIAGGAAHFSIGYSEPEAGTDLAALRTRAVRDGDWYVVTGQKMWTSLVGYADFVWLACRTDPDAPKHRGLSILIVPTDSPGFSWTPVPTVAGITTSATYYDGVRVPAANLVGPENGGWPLITNQLNHERVALTSAAPLQIALREVRDWAAVTKATTTDAAADATADAPAEATTGRRVIDAEWVRIALARVHARTEALKLLNWRIAADLDAGRPPGPAAASAAKVYGTELTIEACRSLLEVLGPRAQVRSGSPGAVLAGRIERMQRTALILTFGGGTNEIQRDIIAAAALGLPYRR